MPVAFLLVPPGSHRSQTAANGKNQKSGCIAVYLRANDMRTHVVTEGTSLLPEMCHVIATYHRLLKTPRRKVRAKLEEGRYETAEDVARDVRLIWSNCILYNSPGSEFGLLAAGLAKKFEERYSKIKVRNEIGVPLNFLLCLTRLQELHEDLTTLYWCLLATVMQVRVEGFCISPRGVGGLWPSI